MTRSQEEYQQLLQNPNVRGVLAAIRHGEGTTDGYNIMFGGGRFDDYSRHPDRVISTNGYSSSAAGAYQFLTPTWNEAQKALGLKDFSPASQDIAALYLIDRRGALDEAAKAGFTPSVSNRLAPEWASLPTAAGKSYYGQPVKTFEDLRRVASGQGKGTGFSTSGIGGTTPAGEHAPFSPPSVDPVAVDFGETPEIRLDPELQGVSSILDEALNSAMANAGQPRMAGSPEFRQTLNDLTQRLRASIKF